MYAGGFGEDERGAVPAAQVDAGGAAPGAPQAHGHQGPAHVGRDRHTGYIQLLYTLLHV